MSQTSKTPHQLTAQISLSSAIILIISSIIGSGIYKKVVPMSVELQSPSGVMLTWVLGGLLSLCGALSNAEIAGMMAATGGEYAYFRKIYGRFFAFLFGWTTFAVVKTASIASIAYVFSQSFNNLIPLPVFPEALESFSLWGVFKPFENGSVKLLTITLIVALTALNVRGTKLGESISKLLTYSILLGIGAVVLLGWFSGVGNVQNLTTPSSTHQDWSLSDGALYSAYFAALLSAFWAYEGWNTIGIIGGEIVNPKRNVPIALGVGTLAVMGIYLLANVTYLYVLPMDQIVALSKVPNAIAAVEVVRFIASDTGANLVSVLILITTLGCTHTTILLVSRSHYAMAQEGLFFKQAARIHTRFGTPNGSLWIQCLWTCALVLSGSFDQLTDMLIFAAFVFYGATTLGVFVLRRKSPELPRPYRVWGYPIIPGIFLIFCVVLVAITFYTRPREAIIGSVLMATGLPFYWYWTKTKQ